MESVRLKRENISVHIPNYMKRSLECREEITTSIEESYGGQCTRCSGSGCYLCYSTPTSPIPWWDGKEDQVAWEAYMDNLRDLAQDWIDRIEALDFDKTSN